MEETSNHQVLVLNRLWQAVNIIGVKRTFNMLFQGNARVIYTGDGSFRVLGINEWIEHSVSNPDTSGKDSIQTVRLRLRMPKVLLLSRYDKMPMKEVKLNKQTVYERNAHTCQYCGNEFPEEELNLDHVIPRDQGGKTTWENLVTSCIYCNSKKANRMPHQANMTILARPIRPKWMPFVSIRPDPRYVDDWGHFLQRKSSHQECDHSHH